MLLKKTGMIEVLPLALSRTCLAPEILAACLVMLSRLVARGRGLFLEVTGLSGVLKLREKFKLPVGSVILKYALPGFRD